MKTQISAIRQPLPADPAKVRDKVETGAKEDRSSLKQAAKDFEAIFLETVLKSMRKSIIKSGLIDGGHAEDIYKSMLDGEYAKTMTQGGQTGIASMIYRQLSPDQNPEPLKVSKDLALKQGFAAYKMVKDDL